MVAEGDRPGCRVPLWVPAIMLAMAAIEPLTHLWIVHAPPDGYAATGLHTRETIFLRYWMRPWDAPSPFSLEDHASWSMNAPRLFFGSAGSLGRALGLDEFTTLGGLNGICTFALLLGVYVFLRTVVPRTANLSFVLYALAGGLGGLLYLITGAFGLHDAPMFEAYFERYAHYELFHGKFLSPAPLMVYPHYTLPLGLGFGALALAIRANARTQRQTNTPGGTYGRHREGAWFLAATHPTLVLVAALMLFLGGTLNVRLGPMIWAIFVGYLIAGSQAPIAHRMRDAALLAVPAFAAFLVAWLPIYRQSGSLSNQLEYGSAAVWFSPLLSAVIFHLVTVPIALRRELPRMPRWHAVCAWAALGYLAVFTSLYAAHALYYGNLLLCNDTTPPLKFSDFSLLGALIGAVGRLASRSRHRRPIRQSRSAWIILWLLAFVIFSISAFGRGWWLSLTPQRLMVFYGVPLAVVSAHGLAIFHASRPRHARALATLMIGCGIVSIGVGAFAFRGPLGPRPGEAPYGLHRAELMRLDDAQCVQLAGPGFVLAPLATNPAFGDVIAAHRSDVTVFGVGSFGLSGLDYGDLEARVTDFFAPGTTEGRRRSFVDQWNVDWIYVPATPAGYTPTIEELDRYTWLDRHCAGTAAALYAVLRDAN